MKLSKGFKTLKKCMAFLMVLTLLITVPTFEGKDAVAAPTDVVEIPDADLKAIINSYLNQDATADVTVEQMQSLTYINAGYNRTVSDLTGLEYCTNLKTLGLEADAGVILDLTPIAGLTTLEKLYIHGVKDLTPIKGLTNLTLLDLSDSEEITDITPLKSLPNLTCLDLDRCKGITDFSPVSSLVNLEELVMTSVNMTVLPDLSALTKLNKLHIYGYDNNTRLLTDISGLANCTSLEYLDMDYQYKLEDITPLKGLTNLKTLYMQGVGVTEENAEGYMEAISSLVNIERLSMPYCDISDENTSMFDPLTKLNYLVVGVNDITDIEFLLKHKDTLKTFNIVSNDVDNAGAEVLAQMTKLEIIGIDGNSITDFSFISKLPNLTNNSVRFSEWNEQWPSYQSISIEDAVFVTEGSYTFENMFKDENGNPIVPVESEDGAYTYDATTNTITVPLSTTSNSTNVVVKYDFDMYTVSGRKLIAEAGCRVNLAHKKELVIVTQPRDISVVEEESLNLSVAVTGNYPYTYQWYKDGVAIEGATSYSYYKSAAQQSDEGEYKVVVTDKYGSITSETAEVDVTVRKLEASISSGIKVLEGNDFSIRVSASGTGELSYQWYKDGEKLVGETSYLLKIEDAELSQAGEYYVDVTDKYDTVSSNSCQVTVIPNELTLTHPKSADLTVGDSTTLSVSVAEKDEYTYQWYKDGEKIAGATASKLELKDVKLEDAGDYYVIVNGTYASATSKVAKVTVEEETTATTEEETTTATEEETTTSTEDETTAATTEKVDEEPVTGDVSTFGLVALLVLMALAGVTSFKLRNKI